MNHGAVLIIDDDDNLRDLVRLVIEAMHVDVFEAATCAEGIALLRANHDRIRLVLLDYFMPGMDPSTCAKKVRSLAEPATVVLCTAAVNAEARATDLGLSCWLGKPFPLSSLEALVRGAARLPGSF